MKMLPISSLCLLILLTHSLALVADDDIVILGKHTDKGFKVGKGSYIDVPEDVQLKRVAHNVIKQESSEEYIARKFDNIHAEFVELKESITDRFEKLEQRINQLELEASAAVSQNKSQG